MEQQQEGQFDYKQFLLDLAQAISDDEPQKMLVVLNTVEAHLKRLYLTLKKLNKTNVQQQKVIDELTQQCRKHYDNAQKVIRYELKIEDKVQYAKGTVHETNDEFGCK